MAEHRLSASDDGTDVRAAVGDRLVLRLPENGGTGYLWQLDLSPSLRLVDDAPEPAPLAAGVGGTGLHRFVLEVDGPGRVSGRLAQPWNPADVDQTWSVAVVV